MTTPPVAPDDMPISFYVGVAKLPQNGMPVHFRPDEAEREALARFLGIVAVTELSAELLVRKWKRDGVAVTGRLKGRVVQESVVTLEPVGQDIDEVIDGIFVPEGSKLARILPEGDGELHLDPNGDDIPETFRGDRIDLGAYLCEAVGLALEPYPRESDAEFEEYDTDPAPDEGKVSPFAALAKLKGTPPT
ncbi:DUF177 domain-containing protein [Aureimonas sp. AU4]|uniref:YceD family protein n=1 Tax=Aureimonas sp. AU4 TaxID=1638163 RepID=UPI0007826884|nr:DUF177 domain-containing protein [Aureimonas sp. AU4]